jgi:2-methylcitrate dehydratase PrpD
MHEMARADLYENSLTAFLSSFIEKTSYEDIPRDARTVAKQCLLDWLGVSIAARHDPLVQILIDDCTSEAGPGTCTILGRSTRLPTLQAALVNGAMGHALDYDDVLPQVGHPTAPVAPAVLALGEQLGSSGTDLLTAFVVGFETELRVAKFMGPSHYAKGWHGTATYGTFGAMAASAKLLALDQSQIRHAFGLAGTQAAGLKCVFGTMTKPFHAGRAAQNGLFASRLAKRGFTSSTNVLEDVQGFGDTQSESRDASIAVAEPGRFHLQNTLFKYHAACYLTQSSIEAATSLRDEFDLVPGMIESVAIHVAPGHLRVCNIESPRSGLECKFSLRMTAAMALSGEETASELVYSDVNAARSDLVGLRERITVVPSSAGTLSTVEINLRDGRRLSKTADVAVVETDLAKQQHKIDNKFHRLVDSHLGADCAAKIARALAELERGSVSQLTRWVGDGAVTTKGN